MKVSKAVILCGGFGTRFLPATKVMPKELMPIVDKPALWYIVEEVASAGIKDLLIIIAEGKESIKNLFAENERLNNHLRAKGLDDLMKVANRDFGVNITFKMQQSQKGSGDAVYLAKDFADGEPIAVLFGDDVVNDTDNDYEHDESEEHIEAGFPVPEVRDSAKADHTDRASEVAEAVEHACELTRVNMALELEV